VDHTNTWPAGADKEFLRLWNPPGPERSLSEQWAEACGALGRAMEEPVVISANLPSIQFLMDEADCPVCELVLFIYEEKAEGLTPEWIEEVPASWRGRRFANTLQRPDKIPHTWLEEFRTYKHLRDRKVCDKIELDKCRFREVLERGVSFELWLERADLQPACRMFFVRQILAQGDCFVKRLEPVVDAYCLQALSMFKCERQWSKVLGIGTANWVLEECRRRHNAKHN